MPFYNKYCPLFFILFFSSIAVNPVFAQKFERIETAAGLGIMKENNGTAVADFDGDGDLDIFIVAKNKDDSKDEKTRSRLFRNDNNGAFSDVTNAAGLANLFPNEDPTGPNPALDGVKYGVSWGDYDNDGFPDLFFTHLYKVLLFRNNGNGTFTDKTIQAGLVKSNSCWNTSASWFDFNKDGFLDIYIGNWEKCDYNTFYLNNGNGTFRNATDKVNGTVKKKRTYMGFPFDMNADGWMDLYVTNDGSVPNDLYINVDGNSSFEDAKKYGLDNAGTDMSIGIGDYNNDGNFDFFISNINKNAFLKNNGNNIFSNIAVEKNMLNTGWAWDNIFADFDLDGDEDLFIVNGFSLTGPQKNRYFKNLFNEGKDSFLDASDEVGLGDSTIGTSACAFDFDNDGDLDVYVSNNDRASYFYNNPTIKTNQTNAVKWFKIALQGTKSNRDAIGTTITVSTDVGSFHRYYTGLGFLSQSLQPAHFGLGKATKINEVTIKWPSGLIEKYQNFEPNTFIKFTEASGFKKVDITPVNFIFGCIDPKSCTYNPLATKDDGSCVYLTPNPIVGPTTSAFNNTDTYTYNLPANHQINWTVEGGEILEGKGSSSIKIKWGLEAAGRITAVVTNASCSSTISELKVQLQLNTVSKTISVARIWNEALLEAIRNDFARPTVHARNLFHTAVALYDSWAIYDANAKPYLMGNTINNFASVLKDFKPLEDAKISSEKAMSYAAYRLLTHRFKNSPGGEKSLTRFNMIMGQLGYDLNFISTNYESGNAAALGNYIGQTLIDYGLGDGSNEANSYTNTFYKPINPSLNLRVKGGKTGMKDPNRWQPLSFDTFIDQSGNVIPGSTPAFLSPEWGRVFPFALTKENKSILERENNKYEVYHNLKSPPQLSVTSKTTSSDQFKWNFSLVSYWSSHLDPTDGVNWDISPKNLGNIPLKLIPNDFSEYPNFYKTLEGGDIGKGHALNPATGKPYVSQIVPRGDYTRVLAEFWADGPHSETPPGHWFTILNYVSDHALFTKKFNGKGNELSPLEWDVKTYFILGGAMHDVAITTWSIKGWHDYVRPISAIRYMAELGQSTDATLANYHIGGIPLAAGFVEIVKNGDALSGSNNENVGKIKVFAWRGHDFITNTSTDAAGVGWILAENWWPYQRPTFVTPPFAGYISGHSTFSRAAAEVMTLLTGDAFFPGGMGEFKAKKNDFLVFEKGPSVDVTLQWATYRDASDQTSLSRIWGGIHPPADDLPGRLLGEKIGIDAYNFALPYFSSNTVVDTSNEIAVYPNPAINKEVNVSNTKASDNFILFDLSGKSFSPTEKIFNESTGTTLVKLPQTITSGIYVLKVNDRAKLLFVK
jgi:ASPIC and UnbV/FG-GAP-like repeat